MTDPDKILPTSPKGALWRNLLRLALIVLAVFLLHRLFTWGRAEALIADQGGVGLQTWLLLALLAIYALMIAIPFVPGIEVGLAVMMIEGGWVTPAVYGATVLGLMLAYATGWLLPHASLRLLLADLRLYRMAHMLDHIAPLTLDERLERLADSLPARLGRIVRRYRYVALAVLINLPGNAVLGGGGGLLLSAGVSRLFLPISTLVTILLAVAPVPLAVGLFGWHFG